MVPVLNVCLKILHNSVIYLWKLAYFQDLNMLRKHPQLSSSDFSSTILPPSISQSIPWVREAESTLCHYEHLQYT